MTKTISFASTTSPSKQQIQSPSKHVINLDVAATSLKTISLLDAEPAIPKIQTIPNADKSCIQVRSIQVPKEHPTWLDVSLPYVPIYHELGTGFSSSTTAPYYTITESGHRALEYATGDLHDMFFKATEYVLDHEEEVGGFFHIPQVLWPLIRKSWSKSKDDIVSGRFDFAMTNEGLKVYEYNADSASCLLECGYTQDAWSVAAGLSSIGHSSSENLFGQLVSTWKKLAVEGPLHIMCDRDIEERYHATYMQAAAEQAGISCVFLVGIDGITWSADRTYLQDKNGQQIKNIWKTWCWRTVMNQVETRGSIDAIETPQLMDILLHESVRVFEPLWTLLAGSKAILPILSQLFPKSPYLLKSSFKEQDVSQYVHGYVAKPVMGRTGSNISIYGADHQLLNETGGRWSNDTIVYQEIAMLPQFKEMYVQVNTWAINGKFGGTVLRQDASSIIGLNSEIPSLRVVPDAYQPNDIH